MEGQGKKGRKKNKPGDNAPASSGSSGQQTPAETSAQPFSQEGGGKGKKKYPQSGSGDGGDAHQTPAPKQKKQQQQQQQQQQQSSIATQASAEQQAPCAPGGSGDGQQIASKDQGKKDWKQKKQQDQQQQGHQQQGQQPDASTSAQQPKLSYKQKKQQQQQAPPSMPTPSSSGQTPSEESGAGDGQQSAPKDTAKKDSKQKFSMLKQEKQQQQQQQQQQEQQSHTSDELQSSTGVGGNSDEQQIAPKGQGKKDWKQKKQQDQQQQGHQQQGQQPDASTSAQQPKLSYKQRQQMKQQSEKPEPEPKPVTPTSTHSSSPAHAAALERVEEDFSSMKIDKQKIHMSHRMQVLERANAFGTRGKPIKFEVNYIQLFVNNLINVAYHYDVEIKPPASRKWQRAAFAAFSREVFPGHNFAFDGNKNAYSAKRLKADYYENVVTTREDNRDRKFTVTMKEAAVVDIGCLKNYQNSNNFTKPMAAIQCLDVVLRTAYENNPNFVKFKKSIYAVPRQIEDIGANHELWYGLFQSALLGAKPFLNIDVSHKAFPSGGKLTDIIKGMNYPPGLPDELPRGLETNLNNFLKGMEISYAGPDGVDKIFKYNKLKGPADQERFKLESGEVLTVAQYFRQQGRVLQYPRWPVMHVGSTIRNILLPMEMCSVPRGQALTKKHPDSCTQMIIRRSATDTLTRKNKIMHLFMDIKYNLAPTIKEFGLSVGDRFEEIAGRILDPPYLLYRNNKTVQPVRGEWRADNCNYILPSTQIIQRALRWTIVNLDIRTRADAIDRFGRMIFDVSKKQNVQLEQFTMANNFCEPRNWKAWRTEFPHIFMNLKKQNMDLVIVIIPASGGPNGDVYAAVKQQAELHTGLLTQCVKGDTIFRKGNDLSTLNNIWLKINAKTNGSNHALVPNCKPPIARANVMYIGADVTHPSPEQTNIPSVVGVTASYDQEGFRYSCCYRLQNPTDEMIRDLENIVNRQIRLFHQQNGCFPERIMYYRDGVSEGQFAEILTIELRAIKDAAAKVNPNYKPQVTFIVVQKRHHARFFPNGQCPTVGKNNNVPPGTIVDRHITAPNQYQFYLVSHAAVQGVAKPTKYCVLYDDSNCHPDQLQALTYNLCHMFARCNRAVSYPAPTYYAHLAAFRGRVYIKDRPLKMDNLLQEYQSMQIKAEIIDGHPMFFV
ncbi:protein argonaute-2 isoform X2 [Sabethes cyaneus]|uniref:protein argonaute-2 isoform X2 n=1 Tax=Sabethes cyaneus TaxID=53552 RepID=UPI00237E2C42|nr:protein argonaute-2 isoform X2 [Sabethes cyaneus]